MRNKGGTLRLRIIAAADELFYQQGYENTSFSDIADVVGISRGNFYYHFKSKDEILDAVIDARITRFKEMLNEWDKKTTDPKQRLHYYIDMQSRNQEKIISHGCPVGSLCTELAKIRHFMLVDANKMFTVFRDWLTTQLELVGVKKNAKQLSMHLLARGQGIATVSNAFEDKAFLHQEVTQLKQWLDVEILKASH
ncbi:MAG: TetR/AcrR family transcriptional regulator [Candidatus Thiodiazotropha sp. (ex Epidulcina cf. delphinae)]|nr:TetR/AcrR family transcriptional regulator [Candidatus Thiodiazotropha sp. (ex Epidulcina cf. delphinae)]